MPRKRFWDDTPEEKSWYDTMQVCLNGHIITSMLRSKPEYGKKRCSDCGAETISACLECQKPIPGYEHIPQVVHFGPSSPPAHCENCGQPFPWKNKKNDIDVGSKMNTNQIFIVHGHDEGMKQSVARTISQLGLSPVILHEQVNNGQTIIEKFETHADVSFAVALLSPDDLGFSAKENNDAARPRARQNVVLELGYFAGKLGRSKVMALVRGNLEIPSDFAGVVYTTFDDAGHWKFSLVRELKAAGYQVDANVLV